MLTNGNEKLGTGIWNFNLPRHTCSKFRSKLCGDYCYAGRGNFLKPWVIRSMKRNYEESLRADFVYKISDQIQRNNIKYIRLHSSGDFYNDDSDPFRTTYFLYWKAIARMNPDVKILAYTRNIEIDLRRLPKNMVIYFSKEFDYEYKGVKLPVNPTARLFAYVTNWDRIPRHMEKHPIAGRFCNSKCYKCKHCFNAGSHIVFVINIMCKGGIRKEDPLQGKLF